MDDWLTFSRKALFSYSSHPVLLSLVVWKIHATIQLDEITLM